jgi:Fur family ferric uptake transcriptional regulator
MAYHTEQKDALLSFLAEHAQRQFTIRCLAQELTQEASIGESTVYRLMKQLLAEGRVRRFIVGGARQVYYQYVDGDSCNSHLHLKCTACGRLFHLDGSVSDFMQKQILATNRFTLDEHQTMLFGICARCREGADTHA